jgi:hypothetical protein
VPWGRNKGVESPMPLLLSLATGAMAGLPARVAAGGVLWLPASKISAVVAAMAAPVSARRGGARVHVGSPDRGCGSMVSAAMMESPFRSRPRVDTEAGQSCSRTKEAGSHQAVNYGMSLPIPGCCNACVRLALA